MNLQNIDTNKLMAKIELIKNDLPLNEEGMAKLAIIKQKSALGEEIRALEKWFESYDRKVIEHGRCQRLGVACTHNMVALDIEANNKKSRLKTLRTLQNE